MCCAWETISEQVQALCGLLGRLWPQATQCTVVFISVSPRRQPSPQRKSPALSSRFYRACRAISQAFAAALLFGLPLVSRFTSFGSRKRQCPGASPSFVNLPILTRRSFNTEWPIASNIRRICWLRPS